MKGGAVRFSSLIHKELFLLLYCSIVTVWLVLFADEAARHLAQILSDFAAG